MSKRGCYAADEPDARAGVASRRGLGAQRRAQLIADLALTPEARVRAAEETARVAFLRNPLRVQRVLTFDRYEDYLDWKALEAAGL